MSNVSLIVRRIINNRPLLYEAIVNEIVNFANLANHIKSNVENELGEEVTNQSIVMSLRRYAKTLEKKENPKNNFKFNSQIIMTTGLCDVAFVKGPTLLKKLKGVYDLLNEDNGHTLNIIHGNYEVSIVACQNYIDKILKLLEGEKVLNIDKNLVSLAMSFSKDFLYTAGVLAKVTRKLHWENINIYENISTLTENIFIVSKKDAMKAYNALSEIVEN